MHLCHTLKKCHRVWPPISHHRYINPWFYLLACKSNKVQLHSCNSKPSLKLLCVLVFSSLFDLLDRLHRKPNTNNEHMSKTIDLNSFEQGIHIKTTRDIVGAHTSFTNSHYVRSDVQGTNVDISFIFCFSFFIEK